MGVEMLKWSKVAEIKIMRPLTSMEHCEILKQSQLRKFKGRCLHDLALHYILLWMKKSSFNFQMANEISILQ